MTARSGGVGLLLALVVTVLALGAVTALPAPDTATDGRSVESEAGVTPTQNGTVGEIAVDAAFVGAVADERTVTVEASSVVDGDGSPVDGEQATVTVAGEPVTTGTVGNGSLTASFDPAVLDIPPQEDAEVRLRGFDTSAAVTVDVVHEVLGLDAGYSLRSVPQRAELVAEDVSALTVWDAQAGTYEAVTDPAFDTGTELSRAVYVAAESNDARLGLTFETDDPPTPGQVTLGPGWNFVGSNFDISTRGETTVQDDLVGIDAADYEIFTADFGEELTPNATVGAYEGYWLFADGDTPERAVLSPTYDSATRADVLGLGASQFQVTGVDTNTTETAAGGIVEVTATVTNTGNATDTQFLDLLAENATGGFERVDRTGVELTPGESSTVTTSYEVANTTAFDIVLATDDDETTATVSWDSALFTVSGLQAPGQVEVNGTLTVNATVENTGSGAGTQDVLFALDPVGNFDDPAVEAVAEPNLTLAPGESQTVGLTMDAPAEAGEFEHGIFTRNDSETASLLVGETQVVGSLRNETTSSGAGVTVNFSVESTDDTERDIRAYELNVTFDPDVVAFTGAGLAGFPDNATLSVNDGDADEGELRLVATTTEPALTPVVAGQLAFDPVGTGETTLGIDAGVSNILGPGGEARNPVFSNGSVTVESTTTRTDATAPVGGGLRWNGLSDVETVPVNAGGLPGRARA